MLDRSMRTPYRRSRVVYLAALCGIQILLPACADPAAGERLFADQCSRCHRGAITSLAASPEQLADKLRAGTVRSHRFELSDAQIRDLAAHLAALRAAGS